MIDPYYKDENCALYCGDAAKVLSIIESESIDLTVTSPPYDNLRTYKGFVFDFETIARELYRITKRGGACVWVVGDATIDGSETLTSAKQKIFFREECGWNIHDTMIYRKSNFSHPEKNRYHSVFEYTIVLSKGPPKTFNPIKDKKNSYVGTGTFGKNTNRQRDGSMQIRKRSIITEYGMRGNVWDGPTSGQENVCESSPHPAMMPSWLAEDHIRSWSNEGDTILDPFAGSGTTLKASKLLRRKCIGIEISDEYCKMMFPSLPLFDTVDAPSL